MSQNFFRIFHALAWAALLSVALTTGCENGGGGGGGLANGWDFGANDANVYVAFGDSITEGTDGPPYPSILASMLGKPVINEGIGGTTTGDGLARVNDVLQADRPGYLLILYGANDAIMGDDSDNALANLQGIIDAAKANKTVPVIATLPPMSGEHSIFNGEATRISSGIRDLAAQNGIALVDLEAAFDSNPDLIGSDGLHPTAAGYQVIAQSFDDVLQ